MLTTTPCPGMDQLQQLAAGDDPDTTLRSIEEHVRQCPACQERFAGLAGPRGATDPGGQTLATRTLREAPLPASEEPKSEAAGTDTLVRPEPRTTAIMPRISLGSLVPGDRLDKYQILHVLGQGGMGVVFKARDTVLERTVAIKILGPTVADSPVARRRFIREGRSAAAIKDQHVVTIYSVEEFDSHPYIVLEYVEGRSLEDLLASSSPLPATEVARLGAQIAQGLAAAHQKGLIHRDIKPANILLEKDTGRVAITDFGLARAVDDMSISRKGEVCGTPHYMAPEQVTGGSVDHRADLFSLGSVLYYMCTGQLPFNASTSMAVLQRVYTDRPRPVREWNPDIPTWLADLIAALHAKDPTQRIQTAAEVKEVLTSTGLARSTVRVLQAQEMEERPAGRRPSRFARGMAVFVPCLVFLLSLPAFYYLKPGGTKEGASERKQVPPVAKVTKPSPSRQIPPEPTMVDPPKPGPSKARVVVETAPAVVAPTQNERTPKPEDPKADAPTEGVVAVRTSDTASGDYYRAEGLVVRHQKTGTVVSLTRARNYIPLGEYRLDSTSLPRGVRVSPQRFVVRADRSVFLTITSPGQSRMPAEGAFPPPYGPPPFPPPFPPPPGPPPPR